MWIVYQLNIVFICAFYHSVPQLFLKRKKPSTPQMSVGSRGRWHFSDAISEGTYLWTPQESARYCTFHSLCPCNSTSSCKIKIQNLLLTIFYLKNTNNFLNHSQCVKTMQIPGSVAYHWACVSGENASLSGLLSGSQHDNNKRCEHSGVKSENLSSSSILLCDMLHSDLWESSVHNLE